MIDFRRLIVLPKEEDEEVTFSEIQEGVFFRGHNLWLLVISMGIACIGLNTNSSAAVIGAMLISPLMGPIVGAAFGLSIGNRLLIRLGIVNWILMIVIALFSSTMYFLISPFHAETAQLESFKTAIEEKIEEMVGKINNLIQKDWVVFKENASKIPYSLFKTIEPIKN